MARALVKAISRTIQHKRPAAMGRVLKVTAVAFRSGTTAACRCGDRQPGSDGSGVRTLAAALARVRSHPACRRCCTNCCIDGRVLAELLAAAAPSARGEGAKSARGAGLGGTARRDPLWATAIFECGLEDAALGELNTPRGARICLVRGDLTARVGSVAWFRRGGEVMLEILPAAVCAEERAL